MTRLALPSLVFGIVLFGIASTALADPRPMLANGTYWVRRPDPGRPVGWRSISPAIRGDTDPPVEQTQHYTVCVAMEITAAERLNGRAEQRRLTMNHAVPAWATSVNTVHTFSMSEREGGWQIHAPRVATTRPGSDFELGSGACEQPFAIEPSAPDAAFIATSAGPVFRDEASCNAAPRATIESCRGGACEFDEPRAQPFRLPACEGAMASLDARAALVLNVDHAVLMRTMHRLERIFTRGGRLFTHDGDELGCHAVSATPQPEGRVLLRERFPLPNGQIMTTRQLIEPKPLFHTFDVYERSFSVLPNPRPRPGEAGGGGVGSISIGSLGQGRLYVGENVVLLGSGTLYFERRVCEAAASGAR